MKDHDLRLLMSWENRNTLLPNKNYNSVIEQRDTFGCVIPNYNYKIEFFTTNGKILLPIDYFFIVKKQMQKEVLHLRQYKTLEKLKNAGIWHGMIQWCILYVKSCPISNRNKKLTKKAKAKLEQYHSGFHMERVHMDMNSRITSDYQKKKRKQIPVNDYWPVYKKVGMFPVIHRQQT